MSYLISIFAISFLSSSALFGTALLAQSMFLMQRPSRLNSSSLQSHGQFSGNSIYNFQHQTHQIYQTLNKFDLSLLFCVCCILLYASQMSLLLKVLQVLLHRVCIRSPLFCKSFRFHTYSYLCLYLPKVAISFKRFTKVNSDVFRLKVNPPTRHYYDLYSKDKMAEGTKLKEQTSTSSTPKLNIKHTN